MNDAIEAAYLAEFIERETERIDVVASWERLVNIYDQLSFVDPLTDQMRVSEFCSVVKEINRFLTNMRKTLSKATSISAAMKTLEKAYEPSNSISTREQIAYQKLKQQWIASCISKLRSDMDALEAARIEEESDAEWR